MMNQMKKLNEGVTGTTGPTGQGIVGHAGPTELGVTGQTGRTPGEGPTLSAEVIEAALEMRALVAPIRRELFGWS
jgi:hypothetical protein